MKVSIGIFLKAFLLVVLVNCSTDFTSHDSGREESEEGGTFQKYCGYVFEQESESITNAQLSLLSGYWIDWTPNTCTSAQDSAGNLYCYKSGLEFSSSGPRFGEVLFKYRGVEDVAPKRTFEITKPAYSQIKMSKPLTGSYDGYRLVQLGGGSGYTECQNFAYRYDEKEKRLYYTRPKSISGHTTEKVPTLQDFLRDNPTPGSAYLIRF